MSAIDLSSYLWPDADQARQPKSLVSVAPYWLERGLYCAYVGGLGDVLNSVSTLPTDTKLTIGRSGVLASQATTNTRSSPIRFPRRVLSARTELFIQECSTRRNYGRWLAGEAGAEGWSGEYSNTELGWTIHGSGWNTSAKVFDAQSPVSLVGAPRTICGVWNKNKNAGFGRVFVDGREVVRTAGTALTEVSNRTQATASATIGTHQGVSGLSIFLAFSTDLDPVEIRLLSENPWQVFAPQLISFVIESGGNIHTITPAGALSLVGSVTQLHEKSLTTTGSIALTGTALLTFTNGATTYTIIPSGSITLSGTNNTNKYHLLVPQGNITLSGNAVERRERATLPTGSINFSGDTSIAEVKVFSSSGNVMFNGTAQLYMPGMKIETTSVLLTGTGL